MMQPNDDKQRKYRCRRARYAEAGACFTGGIPQKQIEEAVLASVRALAKELMGKESRAQAIKAMKPASVFPANLEQLRSLKKSIDSIKRKKMFLYDQYCDAFISKSKYMEQRDGCDIQLRELEKQSSAIEKEAQVSESLPEYPALSLLREADLTAGLTRELVKVLVDRVLVYDDTHIEIIWRFTDDSMKSVLQHEKEEFHETA